MEGTQVFHGLSVYNLYGKPSEDNYLIAVTRSGADNYGPCRSGLACRKLSCFCPVSRKLRRPSCRGYQTIVTDPNQILFNLKLLLPFPSVHTFTKPFVPVFTEMSAPTPEVPRGENRGRP